MLGLFSGHGPTNATGAVTPKLIDGIVYYPGGQPAAGAEVTVEIWGGSWPDRTVLRASQSTVTNIDGHYEVVIGANYWSPHNTIWVHATLGSYQGEHKVEADAEASEVVDVNMVPVIPEFNVPVAVVMACASVVSILCRRAIVKQKHA